MQHDRTEEDFVRRAQYRSRLPPSVKGGTPPDAVRESEESRTCCRVRRLVDGLPGTVPPG